MYLVHSLDKLSQRGCARKTMIFGAETVVTGAETICFAPQTIDSRAETIVSQLKTIVSWRRRFTLAKDDLLQSEED